MGDGNVLYLYRGVHCKGICVCQNSCTGMLKIYAGHEWKFFFTKSYKQILKSSE